MAKSMFKCPFCSKTSSRGAGLASHIRSAHPDQHASAGTKLEAPRKPKAPDRVPVKQVTARSQEGVDSTRDLLGKAYAQLSERKRVIEEKLNGFDDLRKELETINAQVASLKNTVTLFGTTEQPTGVPEPVEVSSAAPEMPLEPPVGAEELEFTGNKRDFVSAIVKSRGSEGITPKEIETFFVDRKIEKGRNLIYNALSLFVKQGIMKRDSGRYLATSDKPSVGRKTKGAAKRAAEPSPSAVPAKAKNAMTPERRQKLAEAMKQRWAAKRTAPQVKRGPGRPRKVAAAA